MIRILDKHVADKIAAGEVIDRPVSIVKELLENALDADATSITVEIRNGGKAYIRVTDNGCGIHANEAELAFQRHATSKIQAAEDLDAIGTLGFRGEALASICAVSRVELITKTADAKSGRRIVIEGSTTLENSATGCPDGTTITVRDLFYNVPARNKFLASDSAETRRIIDMVSRIALSYGDVKFTLINGKNTVFSTRGNGNILNNIISIYGSELGKDLLPVESRQNGFFIKGFVSPPALSAPSRTRQVFCVNGRVITGSVLEKALDDAYKEKLFHGRFPMAYLFLSMPAEKTDVNVHPTKKEIRFDDPFEVSDFVVRSVREAITVKEAVPRITPKDIASAHMDRRMPAEEDETSHQMTIGVEESNAASSYDAIPNKVSQSKASSPKVTSPEPEVDINNILTTLRKQQNESARLELREPVAHPFDLSSLECTGTIFNTYIMAADHDSFYLIDQHAAHERIFYEKLLTQYNNHEKLRQTLLIPLNFNASAQAMATEESWIKQLVSVGYDMEFFGGTTYLIREIPAFMSMEEAEEFLADFFKEMEDTPDLTNKKTLEKIISRACKSAVKGGDNLSPEEINMLMKDLKGCVNPYSCPHGRPTIIRMTRYEIEKMFKRV